MLPTSENIVSVLETEIDTFINSDYTKTFIMKSLIKDKVTIRVAGEVIRFYRPLLDELKAIETDEELKEAYSHLKNRDRVRYISLIESIIEYMDDVQDVAKTVRKPRKKKIIPAEKLASKVVLFSGKFACGSAQLETKPAVDIVGSNMVFSFNTKYNILTMFVASSGGLSIKGHTVVNYDEVKSLSRRIKPEKFLNRDTWVQSALEMILNKSTKAGAFTKTTGRLGENTLIIRTYK